MEEETQYDVGVVVGRFQVPALHDGHKDLLNHVASRHTKIIVALGMSPRSNTVNDPLDFESRKQMINDYLPHALVFGIKDVFDDALWSSHLDALIDQYLSPTQSSVLYGSRDSFMDHYSGRHPIKVLSNDKHLSGSQVRNLVRQTAVPSDDFRAGVIWAAANRYPTVYTCVDVAIFNTDYSKIALAQKPHEQTYRLIGGFADVNSPSFEQDAYREVYEETTMGLNTLDYVASYKIDDWRFKVEPDILKSLLFVGTTEDVGRPRDDIETLSWFTTNHVRTHFYKMINPVHQSLLKDALSYISTRTVNND